MIGISILVYREKEALFHFTDTKNKDNKVVVFSIEESLPWL